MAEQCPNPGAYKYTWPGRDEAFICELHVSQLRNVAAAIGLHLQVRPIPEEEQWQCDQIITAPARTESE